MICNNCGENIANNSNTCPYCGINIQPQSNNFVPPTQNRSFNQNSFNNMNTREHQRKSKAIAMILCIISLLGIGGLHRFYVGRTASGILHILTFGLLWTGTVKDLKAIISDTFTDSQGNKLKS